MRDRSQTLKVILAIAIALLLLGAGIYYLFVRNNSVGNSNSNSNTTPAPSITLLPTDTVATTITAFPSPSTSTSITSAPTAIVKVYFSKNPDSNNDFTFTVSTDRSTTRADVGTFGLEQLILGPTASEQSQGLFTPLKLTGMTYCTDISTSAAKDFTLNIDSNKRATVKFCRDIVSNGVGDDARIKSTVEKTLKQFPTVEKVVILTKDDNCFGDQSGMNLCKN